MNEKRHKKKKFGKYNIRVYSDTRVSYGGNYRRSINNYHYNLLIYILKK